VVALSGHSRKKAQKKGGETRVRHRKRECLRVALQQPVGTFFPPPSTPCLLFRFLSFLHKEAALLFGLQLCSPYFSPPQQEDNHLAIATARVP